MAVRPSLTASSSSGRADELAFPSLSRLITSALTYRTSGRSGPGLQGNSGSETPRVLPLRRGGGEDPLPDSPAHLQARGNEAVGMNEEGGLRIRN